MSLTYSINEQQQQLSIDVVELNNIVLKMRPLIKKAKVLVLRELALYIKRLKTKQSKIPKDQSKRLGRKIVNRLSEVRLLKKLNVNKLCKLVLANVNSHDMLEKAGKTLTEQERIVIRVSVRPEIAEFVKDFRDKHSDWLTLVHYLFYKNTSGKWKTSEQKRKVTKRKKKKGDLPFPIADLDVKEDEQVDSTIQKFKLIKEAQDRQLIESQRRVLEDEERAEIGGGGVEESGNDSCEDQARVGGDFHPSEVHSNNPEMKVFISDLLDRVNKGEETDDSLLPGDVLKNLPDPMEVDANEEELQKAKKSRANQKHESIKVSPQKPFLNKEKAETVVVQLSSALTEEGEKTTKSAKINRKQRRLEKAKAQEKSPQLTQNPAMHEDGMLHEIIEEDDEASENSDDDDDDDILGCDDVELKQELKERKAKPGDGAIYRRYIKQRTLHNLKNKPEVSNFKRAGFRKGNFSARPASISKKRVVSKAAEEAPLHPSWEAKRKQKARLAIPIKIVVD